MKYLLIAMLSLSMFTLFTTEASARDCSKSALNSVEKNYFGSNRTVIEYAEVTTKELIKTTVKLIKKSRDTKLRGNRRQALIDDIKKPSGDYVYFIMLTKRNQLYLAFVDSGSCAPYDAIELGRGEEI